MNISKLIYTRSALQLLQILGDLKLLIFLLQLGQRQKIASTIQKTKIINQKKIGATDLNAKLLIV